MFGEIVLQMDGWTLLAVVFRWIHVGTAIVVLGGSVFLRYVLMSAADKLPEEIHRDLRGDVVRIWKRFVHAGIVLFLVSGFYNYLAVSLPQHRGDLLYHALIGVKILMALVVFFLASVLVGRSPAFEKMRLNRKRWLGIIIFLAAIIVAISGFLKVHPWSNSLADDGPYTSQVSENLEKSTDLKRDLEMMWATQPLKGTPDPTHGPDPHASTDDAIKAASRVFNTVELVGKTRGEVIARLGDPRSSNNSIYNFPFWKAPKGSLVYRFDCGSYGWQFNVLFDGEGKVREVQRAWIH